MALTRKRYNAETIETLTRFLQNGGDEGGIPLSDKHSELLDRARYADEKLRENKLKREEIANCLKTKYGISRDVAFKDIVTAESIFSSCYPLNKKYLVGLRIEFLQKKIDDCYIDKDTFNAVGLEKQLREYIKMYPDFEPPRSPKNITYVFNVDLHQTQNNLTIEQATAAADKLIKVLETKEDY